MNRCKDCRFLGDEIETTNWVGNCVESEKTGFYVCGKIKHLEIEYASKSDSEKCTHVVDGSNYFAALRVPADFGCVYWEKKQ